MATGTNRDYLIISTGVTKRRDVGMSGSKKRPHAHSTLSKRAKHLVKHSEIALSTRNLSSYKDA